MDHLNDPSSSLSFASSYLSNGSSGDHVSAPVYSQSTEHLSLSRLSDNLERLLLDSEYDYSDADIVVGGVKVGINRCILAARSLFFHERFKEGKDDSKKEGRPQFTMSALVPYGEVGVEALKVVLNYLYTGKLKPLPPEVSTVSTCVDDCCAHDSCGPAIKYAVELMYTASTFQMKELVQVMQRRLTNFLEKALVEDVIPILVASFHCKQSHLLSHCIQRVERSDLDDVVLEKELPPEIFSNIKELRLEYQKMDDSLETKPTEEDKRLKSIKNIHKALDYDDVELLTGLLNETGAITFDDAYALHYAVAYCDPKIVKEVLGLHLGNTNLRNARGHTVLHVAARRKEPAILVPLLNSGASALETTSDGQTAVAICRRLTRPKDYSENTKQGHVSNKDKICIDLLEREMRRNSMVVSMSNASHAMPEDLQMRLHYFEDRVAFARLLFPAEAKLAMDMADNPSSGYNRLASKGSNGNLKEVDLNETSSVHSKRLQEKLQALVKTVEMGRRFFPHCSEVLDNFLEDEMNMADLSDFFLEQGTPEEQKNKKMRFLELKDDVQKAFCKDVAEKRGSVLTASSSSSSSPRGSLNRKVFLIYVYTGKLKPSPPEVSTCVEDVCAHDARGPAINYAVELMYTSFTFQMVELVHVVQRRLWNFVDKALVEDVIPILIAAFRCQLSQLLSHCVQRVSRSDLDYVALENRVAFAHLLSPVEAKLAMEMADAELTSESPGPSRSRISNGHLHEVDLNETPSLRAKRLQEKMQTLVKTVEKGRRFFPHCPAVLDKFLDNLGMGEHFLEKGTPEEQKHKKRRFLELKGDIHKAFCKDMAEKAVNDQSVLTST